MCNGSRTETYTGEAKPRQKDIGFYLGSNSTKAVEDYPFFTLFFPKSFSLGYWIIKAV